MEVVQSSDWRRRWEQVREEAVECNTGDSEHGYRSWLTWVMGSFTSKDGLEVQRVGQMDATQLDSEVELILRQQLRRAIRFFSPRTVSNLQPELHLLLRVSLYSLSVWGYHATYGMRLQNLVYRDESDYIPFLQPIKRLLGFLFPFPTGNQRIRSPFMEANYTPVSRAQTVLYLVVWIFGRWALDRLSRLSAAQNWSEEEEGWKVRVWRALQYAEKLWKLMDLLNLVMFLYRGVFPSLVERLLMMRPVPAIRSIPRQVSFELLNRQLVWQSLTEFLLFLLPLLDLESMKRRAGRWWNALTQTNRSTGTVTICPVCRQMPVVPFTPTSCSHRYCYYCISTQLLQDPSFCCLECNLQVHSVQRVS